MGWLSKLFGGRKRQRAAAAGVPARAELETRPLADLHLYASRLGVKRYRLLRREALLTTLLKETGQDTAPAGNGATAIEPEPEPVAAATRRRSERPPRRERPPAKPPEREPEPEAESEVSTTRRAGVLDVTRRGHGFLRSSGLTRSPDDAYVSRGQIRRLDLRSGDRLETQVRAARSSERYPAVTRIDLVNDAEPQGKRPAPLERLEPRVPARDFGKLGEAGNPTARMIDLLAPFGPGQSVLISAAGSIDAAAVLRELGGSLAAQRNVELNVVAIGAAADRWQGYGHANVIDSVGLEQPPGARVGVAQLAVEQAKRRAEAGVDAVVLLDSAGALAEAHGEARRSSSDSDGSESAGSGGDNAARLLESARDTADAGSLTIVAIGPDEGPVHDSLARAAAVEVVLDSSLEADSLEPPIDPTRSIVHDREALAGQLQRRAALRSVVDSLERREAWEFVSERLAEAASNDALLD